MKWSRHIAGKGRGALELKILCLCERRRHAGRQPPMHRPSSLTDKLGVNIKVRLA